MADLSFTEREFRAALSELISLGLVERHRRPGLLRRETVGFRVRPDADAVALSDRAERGDKTGRLLHALINIDLEHRMREVV